MELKQNVERLVKLVEGLLIVPYGIETIFCVLLKETLRLLIVPYGIETP